MFQKKKKTGLATFSDMLELSKLWIICKMKIRFKITVEIYGTEEKSGVCNYHCIQMSSKKIETKCVHV